MSETDLALLSAPEGFRWCVQARHGFAIALPQRFHLLANTGDPVARMMRGEAGDDFGDAGIGDAAFPHGFWDAAVIGELEDGRVQPFRLFEFDMVGGRDEPQPEEERDEMWFQSRHMLPAALEAAKLPGYRLLDVGDVRLGPLAALAFHYRWDGLCPYERGGDHGLLVWAPTEWVVFHLYHHCPESQRKSRGMELVTILETFGPVGEALHGPADTRRERGGGPHRHE